MKTSDFSYDLPPKLIAQTPAEPRDACRLLVLNRKTGLIEHTTFRSVLDYLDEGDVLVANKTRVLPARLFGIKIPTGARVELLLTRQRFDLDVQGTIWECLVKPARRLKPDTQLAFGGAVAHAPQEESHETPLLEGEIIDYVLDVKGARLVRLTPQNGLTLQDALTQIGQLPLPPYIKDYTGDPELYQTVYAMEEQRSAAAPTAGLHFTGELLHKAERRGIHLAFVELEVGIDTFRIVDEEDPRDHVMHTERYHVSQETCDVIQAAKARGNRIVAVGTTSVRTLESAYSPKAHQVFPQESATTDLFLLPGSKFYVVDAMITNFHVPRSTLMMLVSAFATRELIMHAYQEAIEHKYRMLSFGDAMLIL